MYLRFMIIVSVTFSFVQSQFNDICGTINGRRFYLEHGETGSLHAVYHSNLFNTQDKHKSYNKCTVEFITCPSCIIEIKFRYLNISRNCGRASVFDTCGCDYVWIYEPPIEDASGEQFCGRFIQSNFSELNYVSQTRTVAIAFTYNHEYGNAFKLDYFAKRNTIILKGYPIIGNMNNASQLISSPFFPNFYPIDLSVEYVIHCKSLDPCRISLLFTDFLIADSSILEFFDWNGQRMYVTSGNIFRPPVIISTGPSLAIRFYANGASSFGFKASYSFILGNLETLQPNIGCGGNVNNLGGGITMMKMVEDGTKFFDCVWIIKPPENYFHRKTHLYVKVVNFLSFVGTTELIIRQGLTSNQPSVDVLRYPMTHFKLSKQAEHVVPIMQGFYISLRGHFGPGSRLAIVYAAFNYKDCFAGSDFLCHNLRCISALLNCDGFDHCGDDSDESSDCSLDAKDHRDYSKVPNFLFPKIDPYSDIATATFVFLICSLGLIGIILAMALLLYRVNVRARHQRRIQDHIETIHAILEEGVVDVEEEIIIPDDPPDYEAPPNYDDLLSLKYLKSMAEIKVNSIRRPQNSFSKKADSLPEIREPTDSALPDQDCANAFASTSDSIQITPLLIPKSPPPPYEHTSQMLEGNNFANFTVSSHLSNTENPAPGPSCIFMEYVESDTGSDFIIGSPEQKPARYFQNIPKYPTQIFSEIKKSFRNYKSVNFIRHARNITSLSEENLVRYFSDSELILYNRSRQCWTKSKISKLKKSFSASDISIL